MQVSTKLFNEQQVRQFQKLTADIQEKQEKISSGKAILHASLMIQWLRSIYLQLTSKLLLERFGDNNVYLARIDQKLVTMSCKKVFL